MKLCFVAPAAWPMLTGATNIAQVGGAELQQVLLARSFAKRGYRVSMICSNYGQDDESTVDGITVYRSRAFVGGLPVIRFFHPRLTGLWSDLKRADADIYYFRTAAAAAGIIGLFARRHGRRFVYASAHDLDLARDETWKAFRRRAGWRDRQLYTLGLFLADVIVAQHARQAADCERWFNRPAVIVPSCSFEAPERRARADGVVLWASTLRGWKRPEMFLELARRLPQFRFRMIGGPGTERDARTFFESIETAARDIKNLEFVGFVPFAEAARHFDAARVFVNTSYWEGFPNTFLQSWARGVPTVSFADTGSMVDGHPVVKTCADLDEMVSAVNRLMSDDQAWHEAGEGALRCVARDHTIEAATGAYETIFARLLSESVNRAAAGMPASL